MTLEAVGVIIALLGLFITIAGVIFALGRRDAEFQALKERVGEDREKNTDQHKEFYTVKTEVDKISTAFVDFGRRMGTIEEDLKEVLNRLPQPDRRGNNDR